jgi:hypothetical protein
MYVYETCNKTRTTHAQDSVFTSVVNKHGQLTLSYMYFTDTFTCTLWTVDTHLLVLMDTFTCFLWTVDTHLHVLMDTFTRTLWTVDTRLHVLVHIAVSCNSQHTHSQS